MVSFELELWDLVYKIKFGKVSSNFQNQLKEDIKTIKKSKKLYRCNTSTYKNVPDKISNKAYADGKKIIENKEVVNRMFVNSRSSCFITLKDRKSNFLNNPNVRLLNAPKNKLGIISKSILDRINTSLGNLIKVNQ